MMTGFIIGMFAGFMLGVLIMSLMAISKRAGRRADQQWFWSRAWQEKENKADADTKAGRYETFDNIEDMLAYLDMSAGDRAVAIRRLRDAE